MLNNRYIVFSLGVLFALFILPMLQSVLTSARTRPTTQRTV